MGKKHVFKMVPGKEIFNKTGIGVFQDSVGGEKLTWTDFSKIWFIPRDDKDDRVLDLPIKFCNFPGDPGDNDLPHTHCIKENGKDLQLASYFCTKEEGLITNCKFLVVPFRTVKLGYENNSHSFVYLNGKLMRISIDYEVSQSERYVKLYTRIFKAQPVEYQYVTCEESGDTYKYYFSDDQGNIIDSPDNQALQYIEWHVKEEIIQDIISSKIPEDIILSKAFAKIFVERLTDNQLETLANTLNNEQLQVLAENLTDGQFLALVDHLTNHQLQTLTHTLDPEKLRIIVPLLNNDQVANLVTDFNLDQVKQIFPHLKMDQFVGVIDTIRSDQFVELIKDANEKSINTILDETLKNRLPALVHILKEDNLHDLIHKLDNAKLAIVARELTDPNTIQMIIESLVDKPEKLQAFAHSMSNEQFKELLDNVDPEDLTYIIHKLPHEKVMSVIGDLSSKDQSKAIIDALKGKFDEQSKQNEEMIEMLKQVKDNMPDIGQAPDFTIIDINNDSLLFV